VLPVDALRVALAYLHWQGGTIHDVRAELEKREGAMIRQCNAMDDESGAPEVVLMLERDIAAVQVLLMELGSPVSTESNE
jgi:hypothetical protein